MTDFTKSDSPDKNAGEIRSIGLLNGQWVNTTEMFISINDTGFRQAVTAVERLRTYGGKIFQSQRHLLRWADTVAALQIRGLPDIDQYHSSFNELLTRNADFILRCGGDVGITMFATPGTASSDEPTLGLHLNELDRTRNALRRASGQPIVTTDVVQPPPESWSRALKVRCRLHYYFADQQAKQLNANASGVLIDADGGMTETSISNIAIVKDKIIASPERDRVLPGVTQSVVEELAAKANIAWRYRSIMADDLVNADEVLLMGTDTGLWFANRVDGTKLGDQPGPVCKALQDAFGNVTASA